MTDLQDHLPKPEFTMLSNWGSDDPPHLRRAPHLSAAPPRIQPISQPIPEGGQDPIEGASDANNRRRRQAETISRIISRMERPNSRFVLTGDMNDPPDSQFLSPMLTVDNQPLVNTLENPAETRPPKAETAGQGPGPQTPAWSHRFNPPGPNLPEYRLFDQIWVSQALAGRFANPTIDRRTKHGGDGSDHDPAWIELEL